MQPKLALCMIVKNEERYLPYCLGCIYKHLDELIIVDTGSTDRTIDIAEGFCELVPQGIVLQMDWKRDFALARNVSQGAANSSHIIWLDGDEVFTDLDALKVKNQLIRDEMCDFWLLPRLNFWKDPSHIAWYPDSQYKIYRNMGLKWREKIHETIYEEKYRDRLKQSDVHIFHYAYVKDPEVVAEKMVNYSKIENPEMTEQQLQESSVQHSFFNIDYPPGVERYTKGIYPEVFDRIKVTPNGIFEHDRKIVNYAGKKFAFHKKKIKENLVSIVIATYNKVEYLRECIFSIYENTKIPFEIVLVDNGSSDDIQGLVNLLSQSKKNIKFVKLDKNYGFSRGYNAGIEKAEGDFILVLNNDTIFTPNFLDEMLRVWHERNEVGDGGLIGPISNNNPSENGSVPELVGRDFQECVNIHNDLKASSGWSHCLESSWLTGLCYLFSRDLLNDLNDITNPDIQGIFFEERLPIYHNDTELNWRIHHRLHKKLWVARNAFLFHYGKVTVNTLTDDEFQNMKKDSENVLKELWPEIALNMKF